MGTITKLTFQEYEQLPEQEGVRYELDEGTLLMAPSPTWWHNDIRDYIANRLRDFVKTHGLGRVTVETEFQLSSDTARTPDIAFVTSEKLKNLDRRRSPIFGAPDLAVEVISPGNRAEDTVKKIHQYLGAGCRSVWIVYPGLRRAEMHSQAGVQNLRESDALKEETLLPRFSLALSEIFEADEVR
ncbi:MAG TPA: Uma2 family endonuclease [Candidatus Angelobacter sp.]|nr:Uma2 family endonuclease [Candidatus Angelobacter sp.]